MQNSCHPTMDVPHAWCALWVLMLSPFSLASTLPLWLSINQQISGCVYLHINIIWGSLSFMTRTVTWSLWKKPARSYLSKEQNIIPPMQEALLQHTKRIVYHAGIWTTCYQAQQHTPTSEGCGWALDGETITCISPGFLSGANYPWQPKPALNCWFKSFGVAVVGIHARKPNRDAPNFWLVNLRNSSSDVIQN